MTDDKVVQPEDVPQLGGQETDAAEGGQQHSGQPPKTHTGSGLEAIPEEALHKFFEEVCKKSLEMPEHLCPYACYMLTPDLMNAHNHVKYIFNSYEEEDIAEVKRVVIGEDLDVDINKLSEREQIKELGFIGKWLEICNSVYLQLFNLSARQRTFFTGMLHETNKECETYHPLSGIVPFSSKEIITFANKINVDPRIYLERSQ